MPGSQVDPVFAQTGRDALFFLFSLFLFPKRGWRSGEVYQQPGYHGTNRCYVAQEMVFSSLSLCYGPHNRIHRVLRRREDGEVHSKHPKPTSTQTSAGPRTNTTTNPDRDVRNCTIVIAGRLMLRGCRRWCGQWYGQLTAGKLRRAGCRRVFSRRVRPTEYKRRSTPVRKFSLLGGPSSAHNRDWCPHPGLLLSWSYINQQAGRGRDALKVCR